MMTKIFPIICSLLFVFTACKVRDNKEEQAAEDLKNLMTLPYASIVSADNKVQDGVQIYNTELVSPGYNLFCLRNRSYACLYNLSGDCLKKWQYQGKSDLNWQYVDFDDEGNLFFLEKPMDTSAHGDEPPALNALGKLDKDSKLIWYKKGRFHHDFIFMPNDQMISFSRKERIINLNGEELPILDDKIVILNSKNGELIKEYSVYDLLGNDYITEKKIRKIKKREDLQFIIEKIKSNYPHTLIVNDTPGDVFHINSIRVIDHDIKGVAKAGDFLISVREPSFVAVLKSDFSGFRWSVRDLFTKQHQPVLTEQDHILVFDNKWQKGFTRVAEIDPQTNEIVWQYSAEKKRVFYSGTRGGVQPLPNGNVLIVSSNQGRIFEVTRNKEIVWSYASDSYNVGKRKVRPAIYRAKRFTRDEVERLFPELKSKL